MKLGFIGCGAMARAIIDGILKNEYMPAKDICVTDRYFEVASSYASAKSLTAIKTNTELVSTCDVVILAVRPKDITTVLTEVATQLKQAKPLVISIAAGTAISKMYGAADGYPLVRVMPNVAAKVAASTTGLYAHESVSEQQCQLAIEIFQQIGTVVQLENESQFSAFVGISGSSPAFTFMFIEAMAKAGNKYGIDKKTAVKIAIDAVKGAATLAEHEVAEGSNMGALIDELCTAGGTTIAGIVKAEKYGLANATIEAVSASTEKDQVLNN